MSIIDKIMGMMTDDEGLFQGGKHGRVGGRIKDALDKTVQNPSELAGRDLAKNMNLVPGPTDASPGERVTYNPFEENDPRATKDFSMARIKALDFDPANEGEVLQLQKSLSEAGYLGKDGKALVLDGKIGTNTMHALRNIQSDMSTENPTELPERWSQ